MVLKSYKFLAKYAWILIIFQILQCLKSVWRTCSTTFFLVWPGHRVIKKSCSELTPYNLALFFSNILQPVHIVAINIKLCLSVIKNLFGSINQTLKLYTKISFFPESWYNFGDSLQQFKLYMKHAFIKAKCALEELLTLTN